DYLHRPSRTRFTSQVHVCPRQIGDPHVRGIVFDLLSGTKSNHAEQHHLRQLRGIFERTRDRCLALCRIAPLHLMVLSLHPLELARRRPERIVKRSWQQAGLSPVRVVQQLALTAYEHGSASLIEPFLSGELDRLWWKEAAVVPREPHGRF